MHRYEYRNPRFPTDFPAQLTMADQTLPCRCSELSLTGTRVEVPIRLKPGDCGKLSFHHQGHTIELNVRVTHSSAGQSGLEFLDEQQAAVAKLVESLSVLRRRQMLTFAPRPRVYRGHTDL